MNSKQWAGKAAIGRLKGEDLAQYNLWLDYLDELSMVDTSSAPDIEWPTPPGVHPENPARCWYLPRHRVNVIQHGVKWGPISACISFRPACNFS
ncbi:hypothetical protein AI2721V1_0024 [Escherichia coli]|nr:hypothetical protein AI2721V1_0024 [Escherichia coli]CAH3318136.1 hypothetical protein AI2721V1_0024 [Escherichia coli]